MVERFQQGGGFMVKATLQGAVLLGLLAWSVPSFAEVQNVKVGGDVTVRAFHRENLDLRDEGISPTRGLDREDFIMQTIGLNIGADLTENVSTSLRLANERDWDQTVGEATEIALSQAYVTIKDLLYSPVTVRVGTQPIVWGRGFVLGSGLLPNINYGGDDRNSAITANEFTDFTAFDAIRATLDLSGVADLGMPLTADYVYIKLDENSVLAADDVNIQGFNLGTRLDAANAELEAYYLNMRDRNSATPTNDNHGSLSTIGFRGSAQPVEGASLYTELAYQFGRRVVDPSGVLVTGDSQQGWAFNLGADYTLDAVATPTIGGEWRYYSGKDVDAAVGGWRPVAPGYFRNALRDFQTQSTVVGFYPTDQAGVTSGSTNQHELAIYGSLKPIEDLTVAPRLAWFVLDVGAIPTAGSKRESFVGTEWDTVVTYDYTDDVQLGVIYALFSPGSTFRDPSDDTAQELITSVSVKF